MHPRVRRFPRLSPIVLLLVVAACAGREAASDQDLIAHGKELTASCHACHTPKLYTDSGVVIDSTRAFSGHPQGTEAPPVDIGQIESGWISMNKDQTCWVGPWGVSFAKNLTPDEETGIGSWSETDFIKVMRSGRHMGSKHLLSQPMPWLDIRKAKDSDLRAIYAYLKTVEPISNRVPDAIPYEALVAGKGESAPD